MASRQINNPASQATKAVVSPGDMLRYVTQTGKAVHTAALTLVYSAAAYILLVSYFKDTKEDGYRTVGKAIEDMEEALREQTGVKNRMLANYLDPAKKIAHALTSSKTMFAPVLHKLGLAKTPDEMIPIIGAFIDQNKDRRIESMTQLREALGYSVPKPAAAQPLTAERAVQQVENLITKIEDKSKGVVGSGRGKLRESQLAQVIVPRLQSKAAFIAEGIKALTETSDLDTIDKAVKEQRKTLKELAAAAAKSIAETGKGKGSGKRATGKGKSGTAHTQA